MKLGMHRGPLLAYLLADPVLSLQGLLIIGKILGAKKTLARIDNHEYLIPKNKEFFEKLGVDYLIYPEMLASQEIASSLETTWLRQNLSFCKGELILLGIKVRDNALILDKKFKTGYFDHKRYRVVAIKRAAAL